MIVVIIVETDNQTASTSDVITADQLARLWREHAVGLELLARARCPDPEDCVQLAFIQLASQVEIPHDPVAWLVRVVRNVAIDQSRSAQRRRKREQAFAAAYAEAVKPDDALDALCVEQVAEALSQLEVEALELITAHIWGGLTFRQIGEAFDLSSSAVHRRYVAALRQLRECLKDEAAIGQAPGLSGPNLGRLK